MNPDFIAAFIKGAQEQGMSVEDAQNFLKNQFSNGKTAEEITNDFAGEVLTEVGAQKTAAALSYVVGLIEKGAEAQLSQDQIKTISKQAVLAAAPHYPNIFKAAEQTEAVKQSNAKMASYVSSWVKTAAEHGLGANDALAELYKIANAMGAEGAGDPGFIQQLQQFLQQQQNPLIGAGIGAGLGGMAGAVGGDQEQSVGKRALPSAVLGGALGGMGGAGVDLLRSRM